MQIHQVKPKRINRRKKRVGRGGKRGTYSGRGIKGQKSRAGRKLPSKIKEIIKKYPKLRGYKFNKKTKRELVILNIGDLEKKFKSGEIITPKVLVKKGLISKVKGRIPEVKILSKGKLSKKLIFKNCRFSKSAEKLIKSKGGIIQ